MDVKPDKKPVKTPQNPWSSSRSPVFLGVRVSWKPSISDFAMNVRLGEGWESDFSGWRVEARNVLLQSPADGYYVTLSDGAASLHMESSKAYERATVHFSEIARRLEESKRGACRLATDAQYLEAVSEDFDAVVKQLEPRLFTPTFKTALESELYDFAYLADFRYGGGKCQVSLGVVRAHEAKIRVAARHLSHVPDVAVFCSVSTSAVLDRGNAKLAVFTDRVLEIGGRVLRGIDL